MSLGINTWLAAGLMVAGGMHMRMHPKARWYAWLALCHGIRCRLKGGGVGLVWPQGLLLQYGLRDLPRRLFILADRRISFAVCLTSLTNVRGRGLGGR